MYIKFDILNEKLQCYKKRTIFAKWVVQNNSKQQYTKSEKTKIIQLELILTHSL